MSIVAVHQGGGGHYTGPAGAVATDTYQFDNTTGAPTTAPTGTVRYSVANMTTAGTIGINKTSFAPGGDDNTTSLNAAAMPTGSNIRIVSNGVIIFAYVTTAPPTLTGNVFTYPVTLVSSTGLTTIPNGASISLLVGGS